MVPYLLSLAVKEMQSPERADCPPAELDRAAEVDDAAGLLRI
jgi:hypothetical protein